MMRCNCLIEILPDRGFSKPRGTWEWAELVRKCGHISEWNLIPNNYELQILLDSK